MTSRNPPDTQRKDMIRIIVMIAFVVAVGIYLVHSAINDSSARHVCRMVYWAESPDWWTCIDRVKNGGQP